MCKQSHKFVANVGQNEGNCRPICWPKMRRIIGQKCSLFSSKLGPNDTKKINQTIVSNPKPVVVEAPFVVESSTASSSLRRRLSCRRLRVVALTVSPSPSKRPHQSAVVEYRRISGVSPHTETPSPNLENSLRDEGDNDKAGPQSDNLRLIWVYTIIAQTFQRTFP